MWMRSDTQKSMTAELINVLSSKVAELRVLRVFENAPLYFSVEESLPENVDWAMWDRIEALPNMMASIPRAQLIDCREMKILELKKSEEAPTQEHIVWQFRAHLYSSSSSENSLWTKKEVTNCPSHTGGYIEWCDQLRREERSLERITITSTRIAVWEEHCTQQVTGGHDTI